MSFFFATKVWKYLKDYDFIISIADDDYLIKTSIK